MATKIKLYKLYIHKLGFWGLEMAFALACLLLPSRCCCSFLLPKQEQANTESKKVNSESIVEEQRQKEWDIVIQKVMESKEWLESNDNHVDTIKGSESPETNDNVTTNQKECAN